MPTKEEFQKVIDRIREAQNALFALKVLPEVINFQNSSFDELQQFASEIEDQLYRKRKHLDLIPRSSYAKKLMTHEQYEYEKTRRETGKSNWTL